MRAPRRGEQQEKYPGCSGRKSTHLTGTKRSGQAEAVAKRQALLCGTGAAAVWRSGRHLQLQYILGGVGAPAAGPVRAPRRRMHWLGKSVHKPGSTKAPAVLDSGARTPGGAAQCAQPRLQEERRAGDLGRCAVRGAREGPPRNGLGPGVLKGLGGGTGRGGAQGQSGAQAGWGARPDRATHCEAQRPAAARGCGASCGCGTGWSLRGCGSALGSVRGRLRERVCTPSHRTLRGRTGAAPGAIRSDNVGALILLSKLKTTSARNAIIAREFALDLGDASFAPRIIEHIPGVTNVICDSLSRLLDDSGKYATPPIRKECRKVCLPARNEDWWRSIRPLKQVADNR